MKGEELKKLRYELGLSLAEAAKQVEVTPRTWARWESGERSIPNGAVKLFCLLNKVKTPNE
jgi:transcriptional regulator with XRE-family HTH domain